MAELTYTVASKIVPVDLLKSTRLSISTARAQGRGRSSHFILPSSVPVFVRCFFLVQYSGSQLREKYLKRHQELQGVHFYFSSLSGLHWLIGNEESWNTDSVRDQLPPGGVVIIATIITASLAAGVREGLRVVEIKAVPLPKSRRKLRQRFERFDGDERLSIKLKTASLVEVLKE